MVSTAPAPSSGVLCDLWASQNAASSVLLWWCRQEKVEKVARAESSAAESPRRPLSHDQPEPASR